MTPCGGAASDALCLMNKFETSFPCESGGQYFCICMLAYVFNCFYIFSPHCIYLGNTEKPLCQAWNFNIFEAHIVQLRPLMKVLAFRVRKAIVIFQA